jgi:2'-hydroxyisoflavone reductase
VKVLVVGGTGFLGGAIADHATACGHEVTIFSRGRKVRYASDTAKHILGDRHADLSALHGKSFDIVADTCAFAPDAVETLLEALSGGIGIYALVSSISVYADFVQPDMDETFPTSRATPEQLAFARQLTPEQRGSADSYDEAYGPLKREAELVALGKLGDRALILRAGLLVGAGDYTDRLTYWVRRIDQGGVVAAPGDPQRRVQLIDVRDAAAFTFAMAAQGASGIFNLTGKSRSFVSLLETCREVAKSNAQTKWIGEDKIKGAGVAGWTELPLWLPSSDAQYLHFLDVSVDHAFRHGLTTRPLDETISDILAWDRARRDEPLKAGLSPEKEALLLVG